MEKILLVLISVLTLCACEDQSNYLETPECKEFKNFPNMRVCSMPDGVVCYVADVNPRLIYVLCCLDLITKKWAL